MSDERDYTTILPETAVNDKHDSDTPTEQQAPPEDVPENPGMTTDDFLTMLKQVFSVPVSCDGNGVLVMKFKCINGEWVPVVEQEVVPNKTTAKKPAKLKPKAKSKK